MSLSAKLRRAPLRLASGAYIVNSGVTKLRADEETAKHLQNTASSAYPILHKVQPRAFAKGLGVAEIAVGGTLLVPIVSPVVAGIALVGVSGALLNMYRAGDGTPRSAEESLPIAKDLAMLGIGLGLVADATLEPAHDKVIELEATAAQKRVEKTRRARRKAKKASRKANAEYLKQLREIAVELQAEAGKRAVKARKQARELADEYGPVAADTARSARGSARELADEYGPIAVEKARAARDAARHLADEYGPVAVEKAHAAREAVRELADEYGPIAVEKARAARAAALDLADEYRPVAGKQAKRARKVARRKTKVARKSAQEYAAKAQQAAADVRDRIAS